MTNLYSILADKYPATEKQIEGRLVFLEHYGLIKLYCPLLEQQTGLEFYKAKFSTGYREVPKIDVVVGGQITDHEIFLLTNPVFSDKYSNLVKQLKKIKAHQTDQPLIDEIIGLYKECGTEITIISTKKNLYQIWFGRNKWRKLKIDIDITLTIKNDTRKRWRLW